MADTVDEDREHLHSHGLRPGAASRHEHVQQLRHQLLDHLDPGRRHDELLARHGHRRAASDHARLDHRRLLRTARGHGDGRDLLGIPDGRWPVLLVGQAGPQEPGAVVVVHRLLQPARPDRRHRQRRLRARRSSSATSSECSTTASTSTSGNIFIIFLVVLVVHGAAEHVQHRPGEDLR